MLQYSTMMHGTVPVHLNVTVLDHDAWNSSRAPKCKQYGIGQSSTNKNIKRTAQKLYFKYIEA